ncbi:histidinol dehydrogenase [Aneurinibacillus tyrosinisolvens]
MQYLKQEAQITVEETKALEETVSSIIERVRRGGDDHGAGDP